jgi:hypothetical protein
MTDWSPEPVEVNLLMSRRELLPAHIRSFVDFMVGRRPGSQITFFAVPAWQLCIPGPHQWHRARAISLPAMCSALLGYGALTGN